jgi:hypothetical protein
VDEQRGFKLLHAEARFSLNVAVKAMWKLCKDWVELEVGTSCSRESAEFGTYFEH